MGERVVRVSNPSRVAFPAHAGAPAVTKLDVVNYYVAVGEQICRSTYERPTTLERWPKGVFEGAVLSTRADNKGDAFFQKRVPKGAPDWVQTVRSVQSCGSASATSSHVSGVDAGAPGLGRSEYAHAMVRSRAFWW